MAVCGIAEGLQATCEVSICIPIGPCLQRALYTRLAAQTTPVSGTLGTYLEVGPGRLIIKRLSPISSTDASCSTLMSRYGFTASTSPNPAPGRRHTTHHLLLARIYGLHRLFKCLPMASVINARRCHSPPTPSPTSYSQIQEYLKALQRLASARLSLMDA